MQFIGKDKVKEGANTTCTGAPFSNEIRHYDRVFVVAEVDDTYIYHVHLEIFPRILQHLDFLRNNPDVKILVSCLLPFVASVVHTDHCLGHTIDRM